MARRSSSTFIIAPAHCGAPSPCLPSSPRRQALLRERARGLRSAPTFSELVLWQELSARKLGVTFRRQVVLGPFIVDFLAPRERVVVEVDGGYHHHRSQAGRDLRRELKLRRWGYTVLRFFEEQVLRERHAVLAAIRRALAGKGEP